jgi:hypothetical protein
MRHINQGEKVSYHFENVIVCQLRYMGCRCDWGIVKRMNEQGTKSCVYSPSQEEEYCLTTWPNAKICDCPRAAADITVVARNRCSATKEESCRDLVRGLLNFDAACA